MINYDGQDLSYKLLRGQDLSGCSFVRTNLTGANMRDCNIEGADFTNAIMHYCNPKGARGTATFTGAKIFGMPKWIQTVGADDTTLPSVDMNNIDTVYVEAIEQANLTLTDLSEDDLRVLEKRYSAITGTYGLVPHGRLLYEVCFESDDGVTEFELSVILNAITEKNITFKNGEFYVND